MKRHKGRISFALGSGVLLLLLLFGLLLAVLTAYHPPVLPEILAAESVVLWLLAWGISLLPGRKWLAALSLLPVWGWLLWQKWETVCYGALIMLREVTRVLSQTFPIPVISPILQTDYWEEMVAATWWLGMVLLVWALLLGWAAARRRCWWATVLLTLPPLLPALLSGVLPAWGAVVLLTAVWIALLLQSSVRNTEAAGRQLWITLPAALGALLLLTVLFPQEGYVQPAWTAGARSVVLGWFDGLQETVSQGGASGEEVDLSAAGPLRYSGRTMLHVESDVSGHFLLRGGSFGTYTGESWENDDGADFPEGEDNILFLPGTRTMIALTSSQSSIREGKGMVSSMEITPVGDDGMYAYCPYQPVGPVEGSLTADRDLGIVAAEDSYRVFYVPCEETLRTGELSVYSEYVYNHYMDVPEELQDLLWQVLEPGLDGTLTAELPEGVPERYAQSLETADLVAQCLAQWAKYDPDTPRASLGEDFVEHSLSERRGYCMHFASAGALMLRLMGIPARYVTGYSVDIPESGELDVADSSAHAWVEIYLEDYGWYPVEMTPGYTDDGQEEPEQVTPDTPEDTPDEPETTQPDIPETDVPEEEQPEPFTLPVAVWLPVLLALSLVLWHFGLAFLRKRQLTQPNANRAVIAAYRSMERMQRFGGKMDPRLVELAGKARFSQYTLTEEERQEALRYLEDTAEALEDGMPRWARPVFRWLWGRK